MKKGFTLIELMIVVVIIGILAAIAIPKFSDVSESARRNACRANMRTVASQEVIYFAENEAFTQNLADLDMSGVQCPNGGGTAYDMSGMTTNVLTIVCNAGADPDHGNITDGVASWRDSD